ncbi:MAG: C39 family peptidase [Clostridia bacterium]|nr:C39 family peptidase [Clostridia bacterium]
MRKGVILLWAVFICIFAAGCAKTNEGTFCIGNNWIENASNGKVNGTAGFESATKNITFISDWVECKDVVQKYRVAGSKEWKNLTSEDYISNIDGLFLYTYDKPYYLKYRCFTEKYGWLEPVSSLENGEYDYAGLPGETIKDIDIEIWDHKGKVDDKYIVLYRIKTDRGWLDWRSSGQNTLTRQIVNDNRDLNAGGLSNVELRNVNGIEIRVFEKIDNGVVPDETAKIIDAPYIYQNFKYPNGCESVSAVMALNYWGIDITVDSFIDKYLSKGNTPIINGIGPDPDVVYCGDPRLQSGWGCNSPVIAKAIKKTVSPLKYEVNNTYGKTLVELCEQYIDKDIPVIIWATVGMVDSSNDSYYAEWVTENGKNIRYNRKLHCLLLVGYDKEYYFFNDPMKMHTNGTKYTGYKRTAVEKAYNILGKQSVVIIPK